MQITLSSNSCFFSASVNNSKSLIPYNGLLGDTVVNAEISIVIVNIKLALKNSPNSIYPNFKYDPQMTWLVVITVKGTAAFISNILFPYTFTEIAPVTKTHKNLNESLYFVWESDKFNSIEIISDI